MVVRQLIFSYLEDEFGQLFLQYMRDDVGWIDWDERTLGWRWQLSKTGTIGPPRGTRWEAADKLAREYIRARGLLTPERP
jgi:hypothetical protein